MAVLAEMKSCYESSLESEPKRTVCGHNDGMKRTNTVWGLMDDATFERSYVGFEGPARQQLKIPQVILVTGRKIRGRLIDGILILAVWILHFLPNSVVMTFPYRHWRCWVRLISELFYLARLCRSRFRACHLGFIGLDDAFVKMVSVMASSRHLFLGRLKAGRLT